MWRNGEDGKNYRIYICDFQCGDNDGNADCENHATHQTPTDATNADGSAPTDATNATGLAPTDATDTAAQRCLHDRKAVPADGSTLPGWPAFHLCSVGAASYQPRPVPGKQSSMRNEYKL